ncbi:ABC transporter ATP-binding protein [Lysobacter panacisoli]|uniref:ABC transporter ATP-binding protein n=1 Tax=Lysobacter panacisoli TaxID=1255263 RepID=A0ABP9L3Y4_9GAMM|nr:ABC transporter ATP-binding protein [Lysobacter panacisoli]
MSSEPATHQMPEDGDDRVVISVRGVGKSYRMYDSPAHRLWQGLLGKRKSFFREFWALRGIDLEVRRGETVGIIGRNGSGKSTLLQMIAGTLTPTEGEIQVHGRVAALLELGSGFNPEFTGRENVYLNATILGLSRQQIDARIADILAFADIGEFIDQPVRSYSSGMVVRLAFAVIAHVDADVLIVDEALAVGDAFFSQKCMRFLRDFQKRGTLLFVSHDAAAVTNLCARALWLENGRPRMVADAQDVVERYMAEQHIAERAQSGEQEFVVVAAKRSSKQEESAHAASLPDFREDALREAHALPRMQIFQFDPDSVGAQFGVQQAVIEGVELRATDGRMLHVLDGGEVVDLSIRVRLRNALDQVIVGFYVKDRLGQRLFGDNTYLAYVKNPPKGRAGEVLKSRFRFRMPILPAGSYMIDVAVASGSQLEHTQQHWIHDALEFRALDDTISFGLMGLPMLEIAVANEGGV